MAVRDWPEKLSKDLVAYAPASAGPVQHSRKIVERRLLYHQVIEGTSIGYSDPDGIWCEVMNHIERRKTVHRLWNELEGVTNPFDRLMRMRADQVSKSI
jgi:hypothetical protein